MRRRDIRCNKYSVRAELAGQIGGQNAAGRAVGVKVWSQCRLQHWWQTEDESVPIFNRSGGGDFGQVSKESITEQGLAPGGVAIGAAKGLEEGHFPEYWLLYG
jgi:hypothetical protein